MMIRKTTRFLLGLGAALGTAGLQARAEFPVTGRPVPDLTWCDLMMINYMVPRDITGGLLAIMRNGCVVYQRGFGWHNEGQSVPIPENALVRIASCTKPITAAAIRKLITAGYFSLGDDAFNVGQAGGGVLNVNPWPSLGDSRIDDITIDHLLRHRGGWNRDLVGDWTYRECQIASDMDVSAPPGRQRTINWILGKALQFTPGSDYQYSNIGYLSLGLIVEQETGLNHITYLRQNVLTPDMWVPSVNFRQGRTFKADQPLREAFYDAGGGSCVFDSQCGACGLLSVDAPYGSWDHEARIGQGGIVLSPETMLEFLNRYRVGVSGSIGLPLDPANLVNESHNGALRGVNSLAWQRSDGVNVFIWFNQDPDEGHHGEAMKDLLDPLLDAQADWPTTCVDGFWVAPFLAPYRYFGSYNSEFMGLANALGETTDGSKLNLKPGNYAWTGTITEKTLLRAPLGSAVIGVAASLASGGSAAMDTGADADPELRR